MSFSSGWSQAQITGVDANWGNKESEFGRVLYLRSCPSAVEGRILSLFPPIQISGFSPVYLTTSRVPTYLHHLKQVELRQASSNLYCRSCLPVLGLHIPKRAESYYCVGTKVVQGSPDSSSRIPTSSVDRFNPTQTWPATGSGRGSISPSRCQLSTPRAS